MSSTSIVIKCLSDTKSTNTPHGAITIGTLILQVVSSSSAAGYLLLSAATLRACLGAPANMLLPSTTMGAASNRASEAALADSHSVASNIAVQ